MKLKSPLAMRHLLIDVGLPLEYEEDSKPSWVEVRQATTGDEMRVAEIFSESTRIFDEDGNTQQIKQKWNNAEIRALQVFMTLAGTNAIDVEDPHHPDSYIPAFTFRKENGITKLNMTESEFNQVWARLPQPVSEAIHNAVLLENDQWNPKR